MAILEKLVVQDFRNIALGELHFSPNINCICGNNGEGKTNLMDAIYYLSMTKSAFATTDRYNFRYGSDSFALAGTYRMDNGSESLFTMKVNSGGEKKLRRDDKPYKRISAHIGELPVVMVSPSDISLVSDSGEERRRFTNSVLSQMDAKYLEDMQQYNRLLVLRNKALKDNCDDSLLEVFDQKMDAPASRIFALRKKFIEDLSPVVARYYTLLSGGREEVSVNYSSDLEKDGLAALLSSGREKDRIFKYTGSGIQRDDLTFLMDGHPIRRCGSQGQQKSFLVALKFAQYELMKNSYGFSPTLLLDDVFDKLDYKRISNLLAMVSGNDFGQIFITDTNRSRLQGIVDGITDDRAYFETEGGVFTKTEL